MIPIRLRERIGMISGREYDFSIMEKDGRKYICIDCGPVSSELEEAMKLIQASGMKIVQSND